MLNHDMHAFLREPMRELHLSIPVRMDDGRVKHLVDRVFGGLSSCRIWPGSFRSRPKTRALAQSTATRMRLRKPYCLDR